MSDLALKRGHGSGSELQNTGPTASGRKHHNLTIFMRRRDPGPGHRASPYKPGSAGQVINDQSPVRRTSSAGLVFYKLVFCKTVPISQRAATLHPAPPPLVIDSTSA